MDSGLKALIEPIKYWLVASQYFQKNIWHCGTKLALLIYDGTFCLSGRSRGSRGQRPLVRELRHSIWLVASQYYQNKVCGVLFEISR